MNSEARSARNIAFVCSSLTLAANGLEKTFAPSKSRSGS